MTTKTVVWETNQSRLFLVFDNTKFLPHSRQSVPNFSISVLLKNELKPIKPRGSSSLLRKLAATQVSWLATIAPCCLGVWGGQKRRRSKGYVEMPCISLVYCHSVRSKVQTLMFPSMTGGHSSHQIPLDGRLLFKSAASLSRRTRGRLRGHESSLSAWAANFALFVT